MRALIVVAACALVASACTTNDKCKQGTVLVNATFDGAARSADEIDVVVELGAGAAMSTKLPGPGGRDSGTIEVEFPHGYMAGSQLEVDVTARVGGNEVASGSTSAVLSAGCTSLSLAVTAGGVVGGDGGIADLSMADMLTLPVPQVTAKPDLVGFTTTLDGSGSTDPLGSPLTFAWAVQQVPANSKITTPSLASTTATKTAFDPDLGGVYKIALTVTTTDGRSATTVANVPVPTIPVFYARSAAFGTGFNISPHVVQSDFAGDREVGCRLSSDGGVATADELPPFFGYAWEAPAGGVSQYVFLGITDFNNPPELLVATPTTDCLTSKPVRVDNNVLANHYPVTARFSPDGTRIVYVDAPQSNDGSYRLVTVAANGMGPTHVIRSSGYFGFTPAIWIDNSTVAWLEEDSNSTNPFTIWKAPDANAAGDPANNMRTQVLRCDQSMQSAALAQINQFEMSPFGMIVAGSTTARCSLCGSPEAGVSVYKLAPNDCTTTNAKTLISEPVGELSWDFALSPDGLNVLFSSTHGGVLPDGGLPEPQADIFFVPADGTAAAQKIAGDPLYDDIGPRYIANGRQFIWTQAPRGLDMGADTPAIFIANADGTHVRSFTPSGVAGERVLRSDTGVNRGFDCSSAPGARGVGIPATIFAFALLVVFGLARRRARR